MKVNWFKIDDDLDAVIATIIGWGDPLVYANFLNFLKIGDRCRDCKSLYILDKCEECNICKFPICLCEYNLKNNGHFENYDKKSINKIRIILFNWTIHNLNRRYIILIIDIMQKQLNLKNKLYMRNEKIVKIFIKYFEKALEL